ALLSLSCGQLSAGQRGFGLLRRGSGRSHGPGGKGLNETRLAYLLVQEPPLSLAISLVMSPVPVKSALAQNCVPPESVYALKPFLSSAVVTSLPHAWPLKAQLRSPALRNEHHVCLPGHAPSLPERILRPAWKKLRH